MPGPSTMPPLTKVWWIPTKNNGSIILGRIEGFRVGGGGVILYEGVSSGERDVSTSLALSKKKDNDNSSKEKSSFRNVNECLPNLLIPTLCTTDLLDMACDTIFVMISYNNEYQ